MPLVRISLRAGKSEAYRQAVGEGVYQALRDTFNVPEEDRFVVVSEHGAADFQFSKTYMDIARSDDLVIIQITVSNTRNVAQKQALYARIAELLAREPGVRGEDVFINLIEVAKENWSFGNGIAQYV
ncbi:4-oxalocrotonate tautomerase [Rhodopseudomonas palustris HaA2]|uniref:4-oxalocrotonate tautomerase n=1 Tax=Rhodopseudomonas palustris (strain HaA2) TaxID=316058 RepID=Q2IWE1_RHOP2|nr:tautomerase family protein [Rhodopseudomonas palustris]ABD07469.1 4-oxalocrotonate tautomerase [Rhodopseudomonas palustris HaA2]